MDRCPKCACMREQEPTSAPPSDCLHDCDMQDAVADGTDAHKHHSGKAAKPHPAQDKEQEPDSIQGSSLTLPQLSEGSPDVQHASPYDLSAIRSTVVKVRVGCVS